MTKKMLSLALAMAFIASTVTASFAASTKCEVKSVDGKTVTLDCGGSAGDVKGMGDKIKAGKAKCELKSVDGSTVTLVNCKKASKLSVGDSVKVKANKKKAIEGC